MQKDNVFKSSEFFMGVGDKLTMIFIDEAGVEVTVDLQGNDSPLVVPGIVAVSDATAVTSSSFTANWTLTENTTGYFLDVATDSGFASFVAGYNNKDVGNVISASVISLNPNKNYYYRIRAYNTIGAGVNSETISLLTLVISASDWFLPSKDELNDMYVNLYLIGKGNFTIVDGYWTSSEHASDPSIYVWMQYFVNGSQFRASKASAYRVRPVRKFTSSLVKALGDIGEAGLVFHIDTLGGGSFDYYECYTSDLPSQPNPDPLQMGDWIFNWDNVTTLTVGTATGVGTGQANTTAIISQAGHTDSAAKLCNDLIT